MATDYDLVVLGGTFEGHAAAQRAAQLGARVAWLLHQIAGRRSLLQTLGILHTIQAEVISAPTSEASEPAWTRAIHRATLIADTLTRNDIDTLSIQGVDVIPESGQVVGDRPLRIETTTRRLTTRALLLATGNRPGIPPLPGLPQVPFETPEKFLQRDTLPSSTVVLGSAPVGLVLSQLLRRWGVAVSLVTPNPNLLDQEDPDVSRWILAQLRAEGVQVHLGAEVAAIALTSTAHIALTLPDTTLTAASLVVAAPPIPNLTNIGIESWLKAGTKLPVTPFLQTRHPRIYACGAVMGGYDLPAIARQEARLATDNALFWNRHAIHYQTLPYHLPTQPEMARVGMTEPQAQQQFGQDAVLVARQALYDNPKAHWQGSTIGFCKLIAHRNGQLLGVHGVGPAASEWVQTIGILMDQKVPWTAIARYSTLPHTLTDILREATQQWEHNRWQQGQWRRDWAENWFNWCRSR